MDPDSSRPTFAGEVAVQRGRLDTALARASDAPLREGNRLEFSRNGPDTYEDWLEAIAGAKRWVHLDNYIFQDDEVGERFAKALDLEGRGGREGPRALRLVWLPRRAALVLAENARGRRGRQGRQPAYLRWPARVLFGATTASCSRWTASTPPRAACASPGAGS